MPDFKKIIVGDSDKSFYQLYFHDRFSLANYQVSEQQNFVRYHFDKESAMSNFLYTPKFSEQFLLLI